MVFKIDALFGCEQSKMVLMINALFRWKQSKMDLKMI